ncbi:MAG: Co2+/Mg2+ efflux protein ApaG [Acidobacteriota bacterium]
MSEATTEGICVRVESSFVPERSTPAAGRFFFAYTVTISNLGPEPAKLLSRHWVITDGIGRVEEVRGPGVVGEQPDLAPGQSFQYTSACPLGTPVGTMHGTYQMVRPTGARFDAAIPQFSLAMPYALN